MRLREVVVKNPHAHALQVQIVQALAVSADVMAVVAENELAI